MVIEAVGEAIIAREGELQRQKFVVSVSQNQPIAAVRTSPSSRLHHHLRHEDTYSRHTCPKMSVHNI